MNPVPLRLPLPLSRVLGRGIFALILCLPALGAVAEGLPAQTPELNGLAEAKTGPSEAEVLQAFTSKAQRLSLAERVDRSEWISLVRIESVGFLVNSSLSEAPKMTAVQALNYRASVLRGVKGEPSGNIKFRVDFSDCRALLDVDEEYLVFGYTNRHGNLQSFGCEDLMPESVYQQTLQEIEKLSESDKVALANSAR